MGRIVVAMSPEKLGPVLLSEQQIADRLAELARQIDADYEGQDLLLLGVLRGAAMVTTDLARLITNPRLEMDWVAVSSYRMQAKSSGVVRMLKEPDTDLAGRNVLIVDDITDSGLTLSWLVGNIESRNPASVEVFSLLRKPDVVKTEVSLRYLGFDIPDEFVVGYGLDYAQRLRGLRYITTLREAAEA